MPARILRSMTVAILAAACLTSPAVLVSPAQAHPRPVAGPSVITTWNTIAARTIYTEGATPIPSSSLYFAFVHLAVFDAVVAVEGRYEPYLQARRHDRDASTGRGRASSEAAAATAAYDVLRHYFPASAADLRADYETSLAGLDEVAGLGRGIRIGAAAAQRVLRSREDDGIMAAVSLDEPVAPGIWRPTPDALAPMLVPWLGFVRPLLLDAPTSVTPPGPDAITSVAYARDFREVKAFGAKTLSPRSDEQTKTALFWNANSLLQMQVAMREQVTQREMDIVEAARAFALLSGTTADALIAAWRAKYDTAYWRPVTAIREADTDGNPATVPDPTWTPLVGSPPYPEYVSGHAAIVGAASGTFSHLFGSDGIDLDVDSFTDAPRRHFATAAALDAQTMDARIWLGLHFRKAMTDANRLGHEVVDVTVCEWFRPVPDHGSARAPA